MAIGDNIRNLRKKKGYTQKQLAKLAGIATITLQQYELGKREPKIENLIKISDALNCSIANLTDTSLDNHISIKIGDEDFINDGVISPNILDVKAELEQCDDCPFDILTEQEKLKVYFNSLNSDGKQKVFDYMEVLLSSPMYRESIPDDQYSKKG